MPCRREADAAGVQAAPGPTLSSRRHRHRLREAALESADCSNLLLANDLPTAMSAHGERIARPIDFEGQPVVVGSSIGISVYPGDGQTVEQLVRNADAALYQAKRQGSGHAFFGDA